MHVVIATLGSLGDLHPYLAIGRALLARGHRVVIATSALHRERVEAAGVEFASMRPDAPEDPQLFAKVLHPLRGPEFVFRGVLIPALRDTYADLSGAATGADLLVSSPTVLAAPLVAERSGVPWLSTTLQPSLFLSAHDPPEFPLPWMRALHLLGRGYGGLVRTLGRAVTARWFRPVEALRRELGLPRGEHPLFEGQYSSRGVLALFSRVIGAPQPDWPARTEVTGFAFFDRPDATRGVPRGLDEFLRAGPPPIVFTLGSTAVMEAGGFFDESVRAALQLRRRALLLVGGPEARNALRTPLPKSIAMYDYAPYAGVLPHAAVNVHQGGIGTLAQALRAGRPQLIVPFANDQPDNAARAARLGVARVIARDRYAAVRVVPLLEELLGDAQVGERACRIAETVQAEHGVERACDAIEAAMREARPADQPPARFAS